MVPSNLRHRGRRPPIPRDLRAYRGEEGVRRLSVADGTARGRIWGVLVTFRRPEELEVMLRRLVAQTERLAGLVVVDNAPAPGTEDRVLGHGEVLADHVRYLPSEDNLGPAGGIALGMEWVMNRAGDADWLVLLDDDDPPRDPSAFSSLHSFGQHMCRQDARTAGVGLAGARFDWRRGRTRRVSDVELSGPVAVDYIGGSQLPMYRCRVVKLGGIFDRTLFFGFDDLEYGLRLRRSGYRLYASGPLWRANREQEGRLGIVDRPSFSTRDPDWRQYYSLRNLIHILRSGGRRGAAVRVSLLVGLAKPMLSLPVRPAVAVAALRVNVRALRDAWSRRMGRTLDPEVEVGVPS